MRALVTGASGFIGSHLSRALKNRGFNVKGLVRSSSDLRNLENINIELVYGDILIPDALDAVMAGCDLVFHAASPFTYWGISEEELFDVTVSGARNVIEAAHRQGVGRVVLTSSSVVAGSRRNPHVIGHDETFDIRDEPVYVRAKAKQERIAFDLGSSLGIEIVAVRPTLTVGGPDYRLSESNRILVNYLKDPLKATWIGGCNIVGIDDVVEGHILLAEKGISGRHYVLGSENLEWKSVHRLVSELIGLPGPWITAWETSAFLASAVYEFASRFTGKQPLSSQDQARMVGRYYWYEHKKASTLGYAPMSARESLVRALSWLVTSPHVPSDVRAQMRLSREIYAIRSNER